MLNPRQHVTVIAVSIIAVYFILFLLPINQFVSSMRKIGDYEGYQLINLSLIFIIFVFFVSKDRCAKLNLYTLILMGCLIGYVSSVLANKISPIFFAPHGYEKFIKSLKYFIDDPFFSLFVLFIYPLILLGWLYGALIGLMIKFLYLVIGKYNNSRSKEVRSTH